MKETTIKVGIGLSGGGARGFAHIGVLKALIEADIVPELVAGTSAGAVIGVLYAAGFTPDDMLGFVRESNFLKLLRVGMPNGGFTKLTYLKERLSDIIQDDSFESLEKPFWVAMTNLNTGGLELRNKGRLFDVVTASSCIPLVFQPIEIDGQMYVDGGLLCNLPVDPLNNRADFIIGINLMPRVEMNKKALNGMVAVAHRCFDLSIVANTDPRTAFCDYLLDVPGITAYHVFQFNKAEDIYQLGYEETQKLIPNIKAAITARELTLAL